MIVYMYVLYSHTFIQRNPKLKDLTIAIIMIVIFHNAAVNCKTHYRTPGNSASWMGHLPHNSDERYRLGSLWSVTTLTNECVNDGHFTWVRPFPMTYDTVVGGIEKSRHAKCVRSAWPVCIDSVARCGSSTTCASMELARCGSFNFDFNSIYSNQSFVDTVINKV